MQNLILLHGALGSSQQFKPLLPALSEHFNPGTFDFYGHGAAAFHADGFSVPAFARQLIAFMDERGISGAHVMGYSLGGYVALYAARHYPQRISKVMTLATKFEWTPEIAAREIKMLDPEVLLAKAPDFAQSLRNLHGEQKWKHLLEHTAALMSGLGHQPALGAGDIAAIQQQVLIGLGDRDKMVGLEESLAVFRQAKNAGFYVLPHTKHPYESVSSERLIFEITRFMA